MPKIMKILIAFFIVFTCAQISAGSCLGNLIESAGKIVVDRVSLLTQALAKTSGGNGMVARIKSQINDITRVFKAIKDAAAEKTIFQRLSKVPWITAQIATMPFKLPALANNLISDSLNPNIPIQLAVQLRELSKSIVSQSKRLISEAPRCLSEIG